MPPPKSTPTPVPIPHMPPSRAAAFASRAPPPRSALPRSAPLPRSARRNLATRAITAALVARLAAAWSQWRREVELLREFEDGCATSPVRLRQVVDAMVVRMHAWLASDGGSKLKMLLTFVDVLQGR